MSRKASRTDYRAGGRDPLRIALLVEPTPFTHVSGYANRFKEQLKYLKEFGDEVAVAAPDDKPEAPDEFMGYPITTLEGFRFPLYAHLCLTGDFKGEARRMVEKFKPDVIHASSPGFLRVGGDWYRQGLGRASRTLISHAPPRVCGALRVVASVL